MDNLLLPKDFLIGTATASYQVEGATKEGGRTDCIWDTFSYVPGAVYMGCDGKVACDQYHRYEEDVALMADLGFESYRFSVSWSRIFPHDDNKINEEGITYYKNLISYLKRHNMKVALTIYHWDLPQYLQDKGGWANRQTSYAFCEYAKILFRELGSSVDYWITINEPFCICHLGHLFGVHAPGIKNYETFTKTVHNVNLAHGLAVREYRKMNLKAPIGITLNPSTPRPMSRKQEDIDAANRALALETSVFLDPIMGKPYPEIFDTSKIDIQDGDMEIISEKLDFMGINFYKEEAICNDPTSPLSYSAAPNWQDITDIGWAITPDGLLNQLRYFQKATNDLPLYITENGIACADILENGRVHDKERISYLKSHLKMCQIATEEGINLKGYYVWSFLDNFEWAEGYSKRFGIVYCDYKTLKRYPKDSAFFLRDVIARNWIY